MAEKNVTANEEVVETAAIAQETEVVENLVLQYRQ